MGTIGGKIGFVAGAVIAVSISVEMINLILGPCFFEEGCSNETLGLGAAAVASLVVGLAGGLIVRKLVNANVNARG
jgi:hypothetical protein